VAKFVIRCVEPSSSATTLFVCSLIGWLGGITTCEMVTGNGLLKLDK